MSNDDSAVQVVVRVRPLNRKEVQEGCEDCSNTTTTSIRLQAAGTNFNFDRVFDPRVSQAEIYEASAKGIVQKCFNGYNGTIFAYGQTGSGKTFSMGTDFTTSAPAGSSKGGDGDLPKTSGIIPRAVHEIFHTMQTNEDVDFKLTVSYLEVYKEEIKDLLKPGKPLPIREDANRSVFVAGLHWQEVKTPREIQKWLSSGNANRATASTNMNATSSRSHAILSIRIEQTPGPDASDEALARGALKSQLNLVDLAGSERVKRTGAEGNCFAEGVQINKGLLALGNVINALGKDDVGNKKHHEHIPYRDSKLTRLLQDSLGGNSVTLMIACVSPADSNFEETISTLRYANRAKNIVNKASVNQDLEAVELNRLKLQVETLQRLLASERPSAPSAAAVAEATATQAALAKEYLQDCQAALDVASELQEQRNYWKKRVESGALTDKDKTAAAAALELDSKLAAISQHTADVIAAADDDDVDSSVDDDDIDDDDDDDSDDIDDSDDDDISDDSEVEESADKKAPAAVGKAPNTPRGSDRKKSAKSSLSNSMRKQAIRNASSTPLTPSAAANSARKAKQQQQVLRMSARKAQIQQRVLKKQLKQKRKQQRAALESMDKEYEQKRSELEKVKDVITKGNLKMEQQKVKKVIGQLEQDLAKTKAQKEKIQKKLEEAQKKSGAGAVALRKSFQQKLDDLKSKMADLQRKTVLQRKELQQKESTLQRARHLRSELDRLQSQKVKFQRQIKEDSVRARAEIKAKMATIKQLQREDRKKGKELQQLARLKRKHENIINRKNMECKLAKDRLRQMQQKASSSKYMANGRVRRRKRSVDETPSSGEDILAKVKNSINSYVAVAESRAQLAVLLADRKKMAHEALALRREARRAAGNSVAAKARRAVVKDKMRILEDRRQELGAQIMGLQSQIYQSEETYQQHANEAAKVAERQGQDPAAAVGGANNSNADIAHSMLNMNDARRVVEFLMAKVKTSIDASRDAAVKAVTTGAMTTNDDESPAKDGSNSEKKRSRRSSGSDKAESDRRNSGSSDNGSAAISEAAAKEIEEKIQAKEAVLHRIKDKVAAMKREFKATKLALRSTQRSLEKQFQTQLQQQGAGTVVAVDEVAAKEAARAAIAAQLRASHKEDELSASTTAAGPVRRSSRTRKGAVNYAELDGSDESEWEPDSDDEDAEPDTPAPTRGRKRRSAGHNAKRSSSDENQINTAPSSPAEKKHEKLQLQSAAAVAQLTVKQLREELRARNAKVTGRKQVLVESLCELLGFSSGSETPKTNKNTVDPTAVTPKTTSAVEKSGLGASAKKALAAASSREVNDLFNQFRAGGPTASNTTAQSGKSGTADAKSTASVKENHSATAARQLAVTVKKQKSSSNASKAGAAFAGATVGGGMETIREKMLRIANRKKERAAAASIPHMNSPAAKLRAAATVFSSGCGVVKKKRAREALQTVDNTAAGDQAANSPLKRFNLKATSD